MSNLGLQIFQRLSATQYLKYSSIRSGRKPHDPVINDIKCIEYALDGTIEVKIDFEAKL